MENIIKELILNASKYGVATYALATLIIVMVTLYKEHWVPGKTYKAVVTKCTEGEKLMSDVRDQLTEQRILNERSLGRIETLEHTVDSQRETLRAQELELARLRGAIGRREARER